MYFIDVRKEKNSMIQVLLMVKFHSINSINDQVYIQINNSMHQINFQININNLRHNNVSQILIIYLNLKNIPVKILFYKFHQMERIDFPIILQIIIREVKLILILKEVKFLHHHHQRLHKLTINMYILY